MTIPDSATSGNNPVVIEKKPAPGLLSLNDVIQENLKKAQYQVDKAQLIVRCETLPCIKADHDEMASLFNDLLSIILNHPPNTSRLFLYIDCEEDNSEGIDRTPEEDMKRYIIKFYTNITTSESWKLANSGALINCQQILSRHNGNLAVNDISGTGCLFSVSLPGKIE